MKVRRIILLILFVLSFGMIGVGLFLFTSGRYQFELMLGDSLDRFVSIYGTVKEQEKEKIDTSKFKITTKTKVAENNNPMFSITGDLFGNGKEKKYYLNLDSTVQGQSYFGIESLITSDTIYYKIKEIMNTFYYQTEPVKQEASLANTPEEQQEKTPPTLPEEEEMKLLSTYLKDSILNTFPKEDFIEEDSNVTLDSKTYKVKKVSLHLSDKDVDDIKKAFLTKVKEDEKAFQTIKKIVPTITKEDIEKEIKKASSNNTKDTVSLSFYIENYIHLKRIALESLDSTLKNSFNIDTYKNGFDNETLSFSYIENNKTTIVFEYEPVSKQKTNLTFLLEDVRLEGSYEKKKSESNLTLDLIAENKKQGTFTYYYHIIEDNVKYEANMKFDFDNQNATITSDNTIYLNEEIPQIDTSNAKDINMVTQEELDTITNYIYQKFFLIYPKFQSLGTL